MARVQSIRVQTEATSSKLYAVEKFPVPRKVKDIQSFLELTGYYRKFIEDFSKIAKLLTKLIKKDEKFNWTAEQ